MISVQEFQKEFNYRHDFVYPDMNYLSDKYSNIKFENIPEAWVCEIDIFLSKNKQCQTIKSISQVLGFLVVESINLDKSQLNKLENKIRAADIDLYESLDNPGLN